MKKLIKILLLLVSIFLFIYTSPIYAMQDSNIYRYELKSYNNVKNYKYIVYIDQAILSASSYRILFEILANANKKDIFVFKIHTYGGDGFSAFQLYNAIKNTKAKTIADVTLACSAGAFLVLACDEVKINKFSVMMLHSISFGIRGKVPDMKNEVDFFAELNKNINYYIFRNFLSDAEFIEILINAKDVWIYEDELIKRFKKLGKIK